MVNLARPLSLRARALKRGALLQYCLYCLACYANAHTCLLVCCRQRRRFERGGGGSGGAGGPTGGGPTGGVPTGGGSLTMAPTTEMDHGSGWLSADTTPTRVSLSILPARRDFLCIQSDFGPG